MPLKLAIREDAPGKYVRSIDDHPGIFVVIFHDTGGASIAINSTLDPATGQPVNPDLADADHIEGTHKLTCAEAFAGIEDIETFRTVSGTITAAGGQLLADSMSSAKWSHAHKAIDFMEEAFDALTARGRELAIGFDLGDDDA